MEPEIAIGTRVRIGGDGKGSWKPYTGLFGTVRELAPFPCAWPYVVQADNGAWLHLKADELEPLAGSPPARGDGATGEEGSR